MKRVLALLAILLLTACTAPIAPPPEATMPLSPVEQETATVDVQPQAAAAPTLAPTNSNARNDPASELQVGRVNDAGSSVVIVGELRNTGTQWITGFGVVATYYDAGGNLIYTDEVPGEMTSIEPGATAPFKVISDKARFSGEYASYKIQYRRALSDVPSYMLAKTDIVDKGVSSNIAEVQGKVYNSGKAVCDYPIVAVAYYDANGQVIAVTGNYVLPDASGKIPSLKPEEKADFKLLTNIDEPYQTLNVWAACKYVDGNPSP